MLKGVSLPLNHATVLAMPTRLARSISPESPGQTIQDVLAGSRPPVDPGHWLGELVRAGFGGLPLPGSGGTLPRWRALAAVAAVDLGLAKLFEGHTDALAILAELQARVDAPEDACWGVWCAEPPDMRVGIRAHAAGGVIVSGLKGWCSGATALSHAIVSGWNGAGEPCLAAVALDQPGVTVTTQGWHAVGMRSSASVNVVFDQARGTAVGAPGAYVDRPGFLHGGAGVAACWYGALAGIAERLRTAVAKGRPDPYRLAHLGAVDVALAEARAVLREAAAAIDAHPEDGCVLHTARARLAVEAAAEDVLNRVPRSLGAGPLCRDAALAQALADLPVFIRQSHAERDQAAHGKHVAQHGEPPWAL